MTAAGRLLSDAAVFGVSGAGAAVATPFAMRLAVRTGLVDRPAAHKFHRNPTPYLGGLAVAVAVLTALIAVIAFEPTIRVQFVAIAVGGAAVAAVGLVDDWRTVGVLPRIGVQVAAGLSLWAAGVRITPTNMDIVDAAVTIVVVVAITNAINLLDNMDGLAAGTAAIASLFFAAVAAWEGQHLVTTMAVALAGACFGFLPYNFSPARIFLGDAGTLFLGFLLSALVIKVNLVGYPLPTRVLVPGLILAVPLFDMTLVVWSRLRGGRPVLRGGTDHSSHRLVSLGATPRATALSTYAAGTTVGLVALGLMEFRNAALSWAVAAGGCAAGIALLVAFERVFERAEAGLSKSPIPSSMPDKLPSST